MTQPTKSLEATVEKLEAELAEKLRSKYVPKFHDLERVRLESHKWTFTISKHVDILNGECFWKILGGFRGKKGKVKRYFWSHKEKTIQVWSDKKDSDIMIRDKKDLEEFYEYVQFQLPKTTPTEKG